MHFNTSESAYQTFTFPDLNTIANCTKNAKNLHKKNFGNFS